MFKANSLIWLWRLIVYLLYLALTTYQLGLPGLHYDEAKEAGINALELLNGAPITAFRGATITLLGQQLPLMVQDYIGALNVYLALPFLATTGIGIPNLRVLPILTGLATLLLLERTLVAWCKFASGQVGKFASGQVGKSQASGKLSTINYTPLIAITLLALSPSFIFWSRQGIFVTNLTQPLCLLAIWQGIRYLDSGHRLALVWSALAAGLALYTKLLAIWIIAPFTVLFMFGWFRQNRACVQKSRWQKMDLALLLVGLIPLLPFLLFNWQTGGTLSILLGNLDQSYYGVDNRAILTNFPIRWAQLLQMLQGDHFWYLGGLYSNPLAPWLVGLFILWGMWQNWRSLLYPLLLFIAAFAMSLFTISDLFITHYALLQPFIIGIVGLAFSSNKKPSFFLKTRFLSTLLGGLLLLWIGLDLNAALRYHQALSHSGGLADHSDATYHLAYHLQYNGFGAPIVLDWGMEAPIRYLTQGAVTPIEIFGYTSTTEPDAAFTSHLQRFLNNPNNVYLLHAPNSTVFAGRREIFIHLAHSKNLQPIRQDVFSQRDGTALFELWKVE